MKEVLLIADVLVDTNDDNETTYNVGFVRTIYQTTPQETDTVSSFYCTLCNDESVEGLVSKIISIIPEPSYEVEIHILYPEYLSKLIADIFKKQGYEVKFIKNIQTDCQKLNKQIKGYCNTEIMKELGD